MIVRAVVIMTSNYKKTGRVYESKKKKKRNHVIFLFLFCISTFGTKDIKKEVEIMADSHDGFIS